MMKTPEEHAREVAELFEAKSKMLASRPFGMYWQEIYLDDWVALVFDRKEGSEPFEEPLCQEYLEWCDKKAEYLARKRLWEAERGIVPKEREKAHQGAKNGLTGDSADDKTGEKRSPGTRYVDTAAEFEALGMGQIAAESSPVYGSSPAVDSAQKSQPAKGRLSLEEALMALEEEEEAEAAAESSEGEIGADGSHRVSASEASLAETLSPAGAAAPKPKGATAPVAMPEEEVYPGHIDYDDTARFRYNPIFLEFTEENGQRCRKHWLYLTGGHEMLEDVEGRRFVIASPITYVGRNRTAKNARYLYAMVFDLDGVGLPQLRDLLYQMSLVEASDGSIGRHSPPANIIVNSGNGLHLYYLLRQPIALFPENRALLGRLKHALTDVLWNRATSTLKNRQYQGIFQGFRLPGTGTKAGERVRAFWLEDSAMTTVEALNEAAGRPLTKGEISQLTRREYRPGAVTLKEAERRWPEWYQRHVVEKRHDRKHWYSGRGLYDWWLSRLRAPGSGVAEGHRYFCLMALAVYAMKCGVSKDELRADALSLVPLMERITASPDNHFTEDDAEDALKAYKSEYFGMSSKAIARLTGLAITGQRRNGRKQAVHLAIARQQRDLLSRLAGHPWNTGGGRPKGSFIEAANSPQAKMVILWRKSHKHCTSKTQCAKDTGLSRPTVRKWWDADADL